MIERIDAKLRRLEPVIGKAKVIKLRHLYLLEDDFREKQEIENGIDVMLARHVRKDVRENIILPPPHASECKGDLDLGVVRYLDQDCFPLGVPLCALNRHMFIGGATGSGKTTLALHILRQLHRLNIPFMVIDWEKSYRGLARDIPELEVFTVGVDAHPLFLNILTVPPGISKEEYAKSLLSFLSTDFLSGPGSDVILLGFMLEAYEKHATPTFAQLRELIVNGIQKDRGRGGRLAGRAGLWKETALRIIRFLELGSSGHALGTNKHCPIETLLKRPVVLEFGGVKNPRDRKFLIHVILNWLNLINSSSGIVSESLKHVIVLEEMHNLCRKREDDITVSNLFRECRKYGQGLIAIDQSPSDVPTSIFSNCNLKASFALGVNQDIQAMSKAMLLDTEQSSYLGMLETGEGILSIQQSNLEPFQFKAPFLQSGPIPADRELKEAMRRFSTDCHIICSATDQKSTSQASRKLDISSPPRLTPMELCVISDIKDHPFDGVDKRTKRLGLHPAQMKELHDGLVDKAILKPALIDGLKLFDFTDYGRSRAKHNNILIPKQKTRGGVQHSFAVHKVRNHLTSIGFAPKTEVENMDIADKQAGLAIEIETGKSNIYGNLGKLTRSNYKHRYMLGTNKDAEAMVRKLAALVPEIRVMHFREFTRLTKEQILIPPQKA